MLKQLNPPSVLWDDNGVFSDGSQSCLDYSRDTFALTSLSSTQDYIYFGLYKAFSGLYIEVGVANAAAKTLAVQYYNGTTWASITGLIDESKGLSRSGFFQFTKPTDWAATTVNSISKYWIRMRPTADFDSTCTLKGMNIVYSDDQDLKDEVPEIMNWAASTETTYILRHQSARDDIVQSIRNKGQFKQSNSTGLPLQIEPFDLLDIEEVRQWSKYLALSKIFENLSKDKDDIYMARSKMYSDRARDAGKLYYASLDLDDDGVTDLEERLGTNFGTSTLVRR
jgi:hypothetical protein